MSASPSERQLGGHSPEKPSLEPNKSGSWNANAQAQGTPRASGRGRPPIVVSDMSLADPSRDASLSSSQAARPFSSPTALGGFIAAEPPLANGEGSIPATPRVGSSGLSTPLLSNSLSPSQQQQGISGGLASSRRRGSRGATARGGAAASVTTGVTQDYVDVVVRLKPQQKRVPDAYMGYTIEAGTLQTPRTGRKANERSTAAALHTPRTARALLDSATPLPSGRASRSVYGASLGTPTQPSRSPLVGSPGSNTHLPAGASGTVLTINCPARTGSTSVAAGTSATAAEEKRAYEFGEVLDCNVSDAEMCKRLIPGILEQLAAGFNTCVLCYGQTGSGKTHTITALAPALTEAIFGTVDPANDIVEVSYIQIYNDRAYDLLGKPTAREEYGVPLPKPLGKVVCEPKVFVRSAAAVTHKVAAAQRYRCTASHRLNARSSRSHTLLSLHITRCIDGVPLTTTKVTLADLAGSERVKRTGAQGEELEEAIHINKSLYTLHSLISATVTESDVKPYRDSLLTRYIAPRLKEWHIVLIVTASLEKSNVSETKNSLEFATTAKRCVVTKRRARTTDRAVSAAPLASDLEELCERLQAAVTALRQRVEQLQDELATARDATSPLPSTTVADREREIEQYKVLLREREADLGALEKRRQQQQQRSAAGADSQHMRGDSEDITSVVVGEVAAREETRESMLDMLAQLRAMIPPKTVRAERAQLTEDGIPLSPLDDEPDIVDSLGESFLWLNSRLDAVCEQYRVLYASAGGLRTENTRLKNEVAEQRRALAVQAARVEEVEAAARAAKTESQQRLHETQDRHATFFMGLTKRTARREMAELYGVPDIRTTSSLLLGQGLNVGVARGGESGAAMTADGDLAVRHKELQEKYQSVANELATCTRSLGVLQTEFDDKERIRVKLEAELRHREALLSNFWRLATPAQKGQLLDPSSSATGLGYPGSDSLSTTAAPLPSSTPVTHGGLGGSTSSSDVGSSVRPASSLNGSSPPVSQGLALVRLQGELRELRQQLASTQAKTTDAERQREEQQRAMAELRLENDKLGAVLLRSNELMRRHEEALKDAETERHKLVSLIDTKTARIYQGNADLERADNQRAEAQRQAQALLERNEILEKKIEVLQASLEKRAKEQADQALKAQEDSRVMEEAYKAKIRMLEWRLHKQSQTGDGGGGGTTGAEAASSAYLINSAAPVSCSLPRTRAPHVGGGGYTTPNLTPRKGSNHVGPSGTAPDSLGKRGSHGPSTAATDPTGPTAHRSASAGRKSESNTRASWLPKRDPPFSGGSTSNGYDRQASAFFNASGGTNASTNRLATASGSTARPETAPRGSSTKRKSTKKKGKTATTPKSGASKRTRSSA